MINETTATKKNSNKRSHFKLDRQRMTKKQRRISNTQKRTHPKIRSVKKGRVIKLQGKV